MGGRPPFRPGRQRLRVRAGAQPLVTVRNGKGGRFCVVLAHHELVDAFRSVPHRSPIFHGVQRQAIIYQDRGPVDRRGDPKA